MPRSAQLTATAARSPDRRAVRRKTTDLMVTVSAPDGVFQADLRDLSIHGCNLGYSNSSPRLGQIVKIEFDGMPSTAGIIRWVRESSAGIEFLRPLTSSHGLFSQILT